MEHNINEKEFDEKFDRYLSDSDEVALAKELSVLGQKYTSKLDEANIIADAPSKAKRVTLWRSIAAIAAILILLAGIFLIPKMGEKDVFAAHFKPYQMVITERGTRENTIEINALLSEGISAYKEKNYTASFQAFNQLEKLSEDNDLYRFYKGISALANQNYDATTKALEPIASDDSLNIQQQTRWYLLLAYYQKSELKKVDSLVQLIEIGDYNYILVEKYFK